MKAKNPEAEVAEVAALLKPQVDESQPGIEFDMAALITQGTLRREVEPIKGVKVQMHVLTNKERKQANATVPASEEKTTLAVLDELKAPTLVLAITKMGEKDYVTKEQKSVLSTQLESAPSILIDLLYVEYQKLLNDQLELLEAGVKKNSR